MFWRNRYFQTSGLTTLAALLISAPQAYGIGRGDWVEVRKGSPIAITNDTGQTVATAEAGCVLLVDRIEQKKGYLVSGECNERSISGWIAPDHRRRLKLTFEPGYAGHMVSVLFVGIISALVGLWLYRTGSLIGRVLAIPAWVIGGFGLLMGGFGTLFAGMHFAMDYPILFALICLVLAVVGLLAFFMSMSVFSAMWAVLLATVTGVFRRDETSRHGRGPQLGEQQMEDLRQARQEGIGKVIQRDTGRDLGFPE